MFRKKKLTTANDSPRIDNKTPHSHINPEQLNDDRPIQNGNLTKQSLDKQPIHVDNNYNTMQDVNKDKCQIDANLVTNTNRKSPDQRRRNTIVDDGSRKVDNMYATYPSKHQVCDRRSSSSSKTPEMECRQERRRQSLKSDYQERDVAASVSGDDVSMSSCHRRVSVPSNRTTPKKKSECGTHVVAKSELWDTGSQHRCQKNHQKVSRVSISQDEGISNGCFINNSIYVIYQ